VWFGKKRIESNVREKAKAKRKLVIDPPLGFASCFSCCCLDLSHIGRKQSKRKSARLPFLAEQEERGGRKPTLRVLRL